MYNLRYHLASLVAVFLAFSLGLVLGSVVAERGYLDTQQSALVESLRTEFTELRDTNDQLRTDFERDRGFANQLYAAYVKDALAGRTVLVLTDESDGDDLAATSSAVLGAGGDVVTGVISRVGLGLDDAAITQSLASILATTVAGQDGEFEGVVLDALAREWRTSSGAYPVTSLLEEEGVLSMQGWDPAVPVDGVVLLGPSDDAELDGSLVELTARLMDGGATAVGVESQADSGVVVEACLASGLSAVDVIGIPQGAFSVVWILAGETEGYYGVGEGAAGLYPQLGEVP